MQVEYKTPFRRVSWYELMSVPNRFGISEHILRWSPPSDIKLIVNRRRVAARQSLSFENKLTADSKSKQFVHHGIICPNFRALPQVTTLPFSLRAAKALFEAKMDETLRNLNTTKRTTSHSLSNSFPQKWLTSYLCVHRRVHLLFTALQMSYILYCIAWHCRMSHRIELFFFLIFVVTSYNVKSQ